MKPDNYVSTKWITKSSMAEEIIRRAQKESQRKKHLSDMEFVNQNARGK